MVNDIEIFDELGDDTGGNPTSINEIILRQIRKIGDICSKEFTGGYWEKKPVRTANGVMFSEVYHDDSREAYCNCVDFLIDLIYPHSDKNFQTYAKNFENYEEEVKKDSKQEGKKLDIKDKLKLKRQTFRQINLMFERSNFWASGGIVNE